MVYIYPMAAEIKRFRQEFTSPSTQLAKATLIYKNEIKHDRVTPDTITNYWRAFYKTGGPKSEIEIRKPLLIGKNAAQEFSTETKKLDTEVSPFPGTIKEIKEYARLGMEPVYVSGQLLGPHGVKFLRNLHSGSINIPRLPNIENRNNKGGWRYVEVNPQISNIPESERMDIPTYITMAAYMEKVYGFFPDYQGHHKNQITENIREAILIKSNTNTMSILNGSTIGQKFTEYNNKTEEAFSFTKGEMFITTLEEDTQSLNLIHRQQIPIFPK